MIHYSGFIHFNISLGNKFIKLISLICLFVLCIQCEDLISEVTTTAAETSDTSPDFNKIFDVSTTEIMAETTAQTEEILSTLDESKKDYETTTSYSTTQSSSAEPQDDLDVDATTSSYLEGSNTTLSTTTQETTTVAATTHATTTPATTPPETTALPPIIPKFSISNGSNNSTFKTTNIPPLNLRLDKNSSRCGEEVTVLRLGFQTRAQSYDTSNITLIFTHPKMNQSGYETSNEPSDYYLHNITVELKFDEVDFPDAKHPYGDIILNGTYDTFKTPVGSHYTCVSDEYLDIVDSTRLFNGSRINFEQITVQAFMETKNDTFLSNEIKCAQDQHPDNTVPVAVGVTLVVCIILALIVFVIFNRRNKRRYGSL